MRTLQFIVNGQIITQDPNCDFNDLVPGSEGYIRAKFSFSPEWDGCIKVAAFFSNLGREYEPQKIEKDSTCMIPTEALKHRVFKLKVMGQKQDYKICTDKVTVEQKGGKT